MRRMMGAAVRHHLIIEHETKDVKTETLTLTRRGDETTRHRGGR